MAKRRLPERAAERSPGRPGRRDEPISQRVVHALAAARDITPTEIDRPLNDSVDPDALDALFAPKHDGSPRTGDGHVEFSRDGYRVVVHGDGEIDLDPVTDPPA